MTPLQILLILRAHYKVALAAVVLSVSVGVALSFLLPKRYVAAATLVVDFRDPLAAQTGQSAFPGYMATQAEIIESDRVAMGVIKALALDQNPGVKQQWQEDTGGKGRIDEWFSNALRRGLSVAPSPKSAMIEIAYTASDPAFAALIANTFARVYIDTNIDLKTDPARQYAHWFGDQGKSARESLEKAQSALSKFHQEKGIVAKDEQLDAEMAVLSALTQQLTTAQLQSVEARTKEHASVDSLPEVTQNSAILGMRTDIARQEAKLEEAGRNLGKNHPQYQRMETEINALKAKLDTEKQLAATGFSTTRSVSSSREAEIRAAISAQKKKLLELKADRDQLAVLQRDVDAAQSAYDNVSRRFNQMSLESQITQTNVSVLNPATEPLLPTSPNIPKIMVASLLGGVLLAGAAVYLLEMINRRVRCVDDLSDMLQVPVLAVLEPPKQPRRLLMLPNKKELLKLPYAS